MWSEACTGHAVHNADLGRQRTVGEYVRTLCTVLSLVLVACTRPPEQRFSLHNVDVTGNAELADDEIEEKIASRETPRFLGLFPGVIYEHQAFNRFVLERDLQRVERLYRSRGYYEARARAARVFRDGEKVRVQIVVEEGEPVLVRRVDVHGLQGVAPELAAAVLSEAQSQLPLGEPLEETRFDAAERALAITLADRGYARVEVQKRAEVDLPSRSASIGFWVKPGELCEFGAVTIEGAEGLPMDTLQRTFGILPGELYSRAELDDAKQALLDLGAFSSVNVKPDLEHAQSSIGARTRIPLRVTVERSKLRSLRFGGGFQLDTIKSDLHLSAGWEDQNFFGGLRSILVEAVPGAVIYPTRVPTFETPERLLAQGRLRTEFRQPGVFEKRTNGLIKAQLSVAPSLLSSRRDRAAPILGYRDYRASVGVDRSFRAFYAYLSQNLQMNVPFAYTGELAPGLESALIGYPALLATLDLRDNRMAPRSGFFGAFQIEAAGVFGDAHDVKLLPEVRGYVPLSRRTTVALRGALGLLFARNYGSTVQPNAMSRSSGLTGTNEEVQRAWVRDLQLMFFRGLFAGGAGSNRGYGPREIGPHGVVPYYIPGQAAQTLEASCAPGESDVACDLPLGGFTLWEASAEVRHPLLGPLSGALFVDMADVSPSAMSFRWRPHLSVGLGLRYGTPVGPIRLDVGYRVPGLQAPAGAPDEGSPGRLFSLPMAASFGIGEPF
jgi:outer membrane protein assembly factor BamA